MATTRNGRLFNCMQEGLHAMMILDAGPTLDATADIHAGRAKVPDGRAHTVGVQPASQHQSPAFNRHRYIRRHLLPASSLLAWRMAVEQKITGIGIGLALFAQLLRGKPPNPEGLDPRQPEAPAERSRLAAMELQQIRTHS